MEDIQGRGPAAQYPLHLKMAVQTVMILDVAIVGSQEIVDGLPATSAINDFMHDVWGYQT